VVRSIALLLLLVGCKFAPDFTDFERMLEVRPKTPADIVQEIRWHQEWLRYDFMIRECSKMIRCELPDVKHNLASRY